MFTSTKVSCCCSRRAACCQANDDFFEIRHGTVLSACHTLLGCSVPLWNKLDDDEIGIDMH